MNTDTHIPETPRRADVERVCAALKQSFGERATSVVQLQIQASSGDARQIWTQILDCLLEGEGHPRGS
jgi:hypothetical protein